MSVASEAGASSAPDPGACGGALSDDLGWALGVIFRSYLRAATAAFADLPGGPRGYQVLAAAALGEPGSQLALARHLGVDRTVMTYLLDDLEGAGLIERRPDRADRRARRIAPTAKGREQLAELDRRLATAEQRLLAGLPTEQDRGAFRSMLRQLATHADQADPAGGSCASALDAGPACAVTGD
ncbi:MAG TPA: MarR family winged helix-turn-helix transcriptional regulator [Streptosporangiaceae bacterium]|nr:MarR family winged helix-turn-helix transcriptional regulator [Streptosporangiaceae bacterium]